MNIFSLINKYRILQDEKAFISELLNPKTQNEAFRKLLQLYQKPLYYHIRNMVLNHDDADDDHQEITRREIDGTGLVEQRLHESHDLV